MEQRPYDLDKPDDLLAALVFAFSLGVTCAKRDSDKLTGKAILDRFTTSAGYAVKYRRVNLPPLRHSFMAGFNSVIIAEVCKT